MVILDAQFVNSQVCSRDKSSKRTFSYEHPWSWLIKDNSDVVSNDYVIGHDFVVFVLYPCILSCFKESHSPFLGMFILSCELRLVNVVLFFLVVDMPLSVRGLDLAPQRADELTTSSKEDLRLMLSVLSGELIKVTRCLLCCVMYPFSSSVPSLV